MSGIDSDTVIKREKCFPNRFQQLVMIAAGKSVTTSRYKQGIPRGKVRCRFKKAHRTWGMAWRVQHLEFSEPAVKAIPSCNSAVAQEARKCTEYACKDSLFEICQVSTAGEDHPDAVKSAPLFIDKLGNPTDMIQMSARVFMIYFGQNP